MEVFLNCSLAFFPSLRLAIRIADVEVSATFH